MSTKSSIWGSIIGSVGSTFSAAGDVEEQARNRKAASELKFRGNTLSDWAQPTGNALISGLQRGGDIRQSWYDEAAGNIMTQYSRDKGALQGESWKYGGSGSPLGKRRWYDLAKKAQGSMYAAENEVDAKADQLLSDILLQKRQTNWQADPVEVNQQSGYSTAGSMISSVGSGIKGGSGSSISSYIT